MQQSLLVVMRSGRVVVGLLLVFAAIVPSIGTTATPKVGDVAPAFIGTTLDGEPVLATDFPGKAVVVSYWATWCTFCIKELAMLNAIQTNASDRVQVVTVNIESIHIFRKTAERLSKFQILMLYDPGKKGRNVYGVDGVPHMIIIGKDGRIESINIGYSEAALDGIVQSINRAIGAVPSE